MNNQFKPVAMLVAALAALVCLIGVAKAQVPASGRSKEGVARESGPPEDRSGLRHYRGENGIISAKTLIMGGEFRVTTVIPFTGNFADYHALEIVKPISLVGAVLTPEIAEKEAEKFKSQFEARRLFQTVSVVPRFHQDAVPGNSETKPDAGNLKDSLDAPIGTADDMVGRDREREIRDRQQENTAADKTLVAVIEVIDYEKGSRWKQALPLDLGKSILTVRVRYYDKESGKEVGRQIISGQSDGSSLLGPLSPRDGLSAVTQGFVDQVTRRIAASER